MMDFDPKTGLPIGSEPSPFDCEVWRGRYMDFNGRPREVRFGGPYTGDADPELRARSWASWMMARTESTVTLQVRRAGSCRFVDAADPV